MTSMTLPIAYELRVELLDSDPLIWRELQVSAATSLERLHQMVAAVMGWSGQADYRFKAHTPHLESAFPGEAADELMPLSAVISSRGDYLLYTYDLAHGWLHKIILEAVQNADPSVFLPYCAAGERNGPPEMCAGVWGYEELMDRLSDPDEPECDALWAAVGYDFDPEYFDLTEVNRRLKKALGH